MTTEDYLESLQNDLSAIKSNLSDGGMDIDSNDNFSNIALKTVGIQVGGGGSNVEYLGKYSDFDTSAKAINLNELEVGKLYIVSEMSGAGVNRVIYVKATTMINNVEKTLTGTLRDSSLKSLTGNLYITLSSPVPSSISSNYTIGEYDYDVVWNNASASREIQSIILATWGITTSGSSNTLFYGLSTGTQTISGVKTFSNIPQQSNTTAPTQNTEFTNKLYVDNKLTTYTGYSSSKTQVLKNINGTITWVDE